MEARELTAAQCRVAERMAAAEWSVQAQRLHAAAVSARDLLDEMQGLAYDWVRDRDLARSVLASDPLVVWARAVAPSEPPPPLPKATFGAAVSKILDRCGTRLDQRLFEVATYYLLEAKRFINRGLTRHVLATAADVDEHLRWLRGRVVTLLSERLPLQDFDAAAGGTAGGSFGSDGAGPRRERSRSPFIMHLMPSSAHPPGPPPPAAGDIRRAIVS